MEEQLQCLKEPEEDEYDGMITIKTTNGNTYRFYINDGKIWGTVTNVKGETEEYEVPVKSALTLISMFC